jgi:hypothetical protein
MKILITEHQFDEVLNKQKSIFGQGIFHKVYESKSNPNIVFKVGSRSSIEPTYEYFKNYPYLFPKTYGMKKLGDKKDEYGGDLYYLILEKLDTQKFVDFWNDMEEIMFLEYGQKFNKIVYNFDTYESTWVELFEFVEERHQNLFKKLHEFYLLISELNDILDYPDVHNGQFGYNKEGTLKCLDF